MGTNATTISSGSWPNRVRRGAASYNDGLEAQSNTRPAHACVRPSCPSCPVTTTVTEEHSPFNLHPFHTRYDGLGNVVGVTDASANVVRVYHNTAFGIWWSYDSDGYDQEVSDVQPYHLTTKEYDSDVGLYYFHARWYARWPGRFISRDPAGFYNASIYTLRPPNCIDPGGEEEQCVTISKTLKRIPQKESVYFEPTLKDKIPFGGDWVWRGPRPTCPWDYPIECGKPSCRMEYWTMALPMNRPLQGAMNCPASRCDPYICEACIGAWDRFGILTVTRVVVTVRCCKE